MGAERNRQLVRIMVVDDDPDTVTVLSRYLQREGFADRSRRYRVRNV